MIEITYLRAKASIIFWFYYYLQQLVQQRNEQKTEIYYLTSTYEIYDFTNDRVRRRIIA